MQIKIRNQIVFIPLNVCVCVCENLVNSNCKNVAISVAGYMWMWQFDSHNFLFIERRTGHISGDQINSSLCNNVVGTIAADTATATAAADGVVVGVIITIAPSCGAHIEHQTIVKCCVIFETCKLIFRYENMQI